MSDPDRALAGRIGAHESWANTKDRAARTAPAREAFNARFERQVDPDGTLSPAERALRAENARKAYFLRLSSKSVKARKSRDVEALRDIAAEAAAAADEFEASDGAA